MAAERHGADRINPHPWLWSAGLTSLVLAAMCSCEGNEHGASRTNLNTMPSYAVGPMTSESPTPGPTLPDVAKTTGMVVCSDTVFVDFATKQVIVRPVVEDTGSGRPLQLLRVTANGAIFTGPQPYDNFSVFRTDGGEDNDQRLNECEPLDVRVVKTHDNGDREYVLTSVSSDLNRGDHVGSSPIDAINKDLVHAEFNLSSTGEIDDMLRRL